MEKLKRHGVDTPFGMFMKSEVTRMSVCMQAIVDDLKVKHLTYIEQIHCKRIHLQLE